MKNIVLLALGVLVLAIIAAVVLIFINSRPTTTAQLPDAPRSTAVGNPNDNAGASQDPLDDSAVDTLPNPPVNQGSTENPTAQDTLDDSAPNTNNPNLPPAAPPPSTGGMVSLPGTAWIQQGSDELYEFCSDNRWQVSNGSDTVTGAGTFEQTSTTLVLSGNGDPRTYDLAWDSAANILALKQGETTLNFTYDGESDCP